MKRISAIVLTLSILSASVLHAEGGSNKIEYKPGGSRFSNAWDRFYSGDHEPELDDPLIEAGKDMSTVICEAVQHKDMKYRRYAIGALGFIADRRSIQELERILQSRDEIYYFRGDALQSIYRIDKQLGKSLAIKYAGEHEYLKMLKEAMDKDAGWLTEPTKEP